MREAESDKQPIDRLGTGIRMATVVVVLGTLVAVWHPHGMRSAISADATMSMPAAATMAPASTDATYFPSRFTAPVNDEPQAPTF